MPLRTDTNVRGVGGSFRISHIDAQPVLLSYSNATTVIGVNVFLLLCLDKKKKKKPIWLMVCANTSPYTRVRWICVAFISNNTTLSLVQGHAKPF